jgi:uncharacterized membrane protein
MDKNTGILPIKRFKNISISYMIINIIYIAIIMLVIDSIYLTLIKGFFNKQIKTIQGSDIKLNYLGAVICYPIMIFGLYYFIIKNKKNYKNNYQIVRDAVILGWVIYGVYESTNLAVFKKWDLKTVLVDGIWGGILFGLTTYIYLLIT